MRSSVLFILQNAIGSSIFNVGLLLSIIEKSGQQWRVLLLLFATQFFKKYFIDPRLKKAQITFESRFLRGLVIRLHNVRASALLSNALNRKNL
jgi:hypothetical protein